MTRTPRSNVKVRNHSRKARGTGRHLALIGMVRSGEIPAGSSVLYAHLGGQPALSAYASVRGLG
jgi:hypothetical protein